MNQEQELIQNKTWNKDQKIIPKPKMRRSKQIIFWRYHRIVQLRDKQTKEIIGWYGTKFK